MTNLVITIVSNLGECPWQIAVRLTGEDDGPAVGVETQRQDPLAVRSMAGSHSC